MRKASVYDTKLEVYVNFGATINNSGRMFKVLIDNGSYNNFISEKYINNLFYIKINIKKELYPITTIARDIEGI